MPQERHQFSILTLLTGITVAACVMSVFWSGQSRATFVASLLILYAVTLIITIRQRSFLAVAALCIGPMFGGILGGLIATFDPMYALPEERLEVLSGVSIVGLVAGTVAGWGSAAIRLAVQAKVAGSVVRQADKENLLPAHLHPNRTHPSHIPVFLNHPGIVVMDTEVGLRIAEFETHLPARRIRRS